MSGMPRISQADQIARVRATEVTCRVYKAWDDGSLMPGDVTAEEALLLVEQKWSHDTLPLVMAVLALVPSLEEGDRCLVLERAMELDIHSFEARQERQAEAVEEDAPDELQWMVDTPSEQSLPDLHLPVNDYNRNLW